MKSTPRRSEAFLKKPTPSMRAISRRRLACMDEINRLREETGTVSVFVERAQSLLLPRYWQNATWRARAEILDSAEWLLRLSRSANAPAASS